MIIPKLHRVVDTFPPVYDELDMYRILRRPAIELNGLSPLRWLLLGRPVKDVVDMIKKATTTGTSPPSPTSELDGSGERP